MPGRQVPLSMDCAESCFTDRFCFLCLIDLNLVLAKQAGEARHPPSPRYDHRQSLRILLEVPQAGGVIPGCPGRAVSDPRLGVFCQYGWSSSSCETLPGPFVLRQKEKEKTDGTAGPSLRVFSPQNLLTRVRSPDWLALFRLYLLVGLVVSTP